MYNMKRLALFLLALVGLSALISACANQGSGPDGGPYDETPPHIVGMTAPERLQNGKRTKFSLVFNELIKVDNPTEKIIVSPPQIETPEIKVSGRRITVELLDSMRPNTTYTVDFSDAITDNREIRSDNTPTYSPQVRLPTPCKCRAMCSMPKISNLSKAS